jgi:hypothetical protein
VSKAMGCHSPDGVAVEGEGDGEGGATVLIRG